MWGFCFCPYLKRDIKLLEKVQNNFTRKIFLRMGCTYDGISNAQERNMACGLHSLESRHVVSDVCMVFKIISGIFDTDKGKFYTLSESRTRGNVEKISYDVPKTYQRFWSFTCRAGSKFVALKNDIPPLSPCFLMFRRMAMKQLLKW